MASAFSDLPLSFKVNPITGDVPPARNESAVKKALINLIKTPVGTRPFAPEYGTRIYDYLFEPADSQTELRLNDDLAQAIERFEPRARLVAIETSIQENGIDVKIEYYVVNVPTLQQLETVITRTA
jgi:phage baseplate assembly protein W